MPPATQYPGSLLRLTDARIALVLSIVFGCVGMLFPGSYRGTPHFFQELFGPAVMFACGQGFVNPVVADAPALEAFLHPEMHVTHRPVVDACDCADIPADIQTQAITSFQHRQLYLLWAAALAWWVFGVAWSALVPLYGLLFAGTALAAYGLFRLAMPRMIALALTVLLMLSPIQLDNLLRLRDFSKAPFILGAIFCIALLVRGPLSRRRTLGLSVACGVLVGVGCGFRMDTLIVIPAFAVVLILFTTERPWQQLRRKVAALAVFGVAFTVSSAPILFAMDTSMKYQDFLLGMNELYDSRLGVGGTSYQLGHRYLDREPHAILQFYAAQRDGVVRHFEFDTPEYEAIGKDLVHELVWTFPADFVIRAYAAVLRTLDELNSGPNRPAPRGVTNAFVLSAYDLHQGITGVLLRYARYAAPLALLLLAMMRLRYGFAGLFLLFWFGGYGAVQFASRHYFHMQFLSFWAMGILIAFAWMQRGALIDSEVRRQALARIHWPKVWQHDAVRRGAVFVVAALALLFVPLYGLRAYQRATLPAVLADYTDTVEWTYYSELISSPSPGIFMPNTQEYDEAWLAMKEDDPYFDYEYYVLEFDTSRGPTSIEIVYFGTVPDLAISWRADISVSTGGKATLYFPAYYACWKGEGAGRTQFVHIQYISGYKFLRWGRVPKAALPPIPLTIIEVDGEVQGPFYQTLQR